MRKLLLLAAAALLLCSCSAKDKTADVSEAYSGNIACTVKIEALSQPACDYTLAFSRQDGTDTVEVLLPSSVKGIKAVIEKGSAGITYDGKYLETLLPYYWGASPVDAMSAIFDCLSTQTPQWQDSSDDKLTLEYVDTTDNAEIRRQIVLDKKTLAFENAEVELDGQLIMRVEAATLQVYAAE